MSEQLEVRPEQFDTISEYLKQRKKYLKGLMSMWPQKSQRHRNAASRLHEIDRLLEADFSELSLT